VTAPVITCQKVVKDYQSEAGTTRVLKGISLVVRAGEFVTIMGPSGSGKSTLMNILGCLDVPTSGSYRLTGSDTALLDPDARARLRNRSIGFVFQGFNLLARATLEDNVALPLVYARVDLRTRRERARAQLGSVGLGDLADAYPNRISGGQQQRVAIARALVTQPQLLLADEPTGNLDTHTSGEVMELFAELNREKKITIILVTHEAGIAAWARRLILLRDGAVHYDGPDAERLWRAS
jgi:putative ABC transport system ATP-binding protein